MVYQPDETIRLDVRLENETVWLTQSQMATLFGCSTDNIGLHLKNVYSCGELDKEATTEESSVVQIEGRRKVSRKVCLYNLDAIISVGYAAKELSKGSYSITYATKAISAMQSARVFPCAVGVGIADHPEEVHTIFLFESGADNSLKAILQVVYLVEVSSREEMLLYQSDGIDCRKLSAVQTGGVGRHWLWRIVKWVSV